MEVVCFRVTSRGAPSEESRVTIKIRTRDASLGIVGRSNNSRCSGAVGRVEALADQNGVCATSVRTGFLGMGDVGAYCQ